MTMKSSERQHYLYKEEHVRRKEGYFILYPIIGFNTPPMFKFCFGPPRSTWCIDVEEKLLNENDSDAARRSFLRFPEQDASFPYNRYNGILHSYHKKWLDAEFNPCGDGNERVYDEYLSCIPTHLYNACKMGITIGKREYKDGKDNEVKERMAKPSYEFIMLVNEIDRLMPVFMLNRTEWDRSITLDELMYGSCTHEEIWNRIREVVNALRSKYLELMNIYREETIFSSYNFDKH